MVYAKVGGWEHDLSDQKPLNRETQGIAASQRGIMKSENWRAESLIKTVNSKHGCQGKEGNSNLFFVYSFANFSGLFKRPFLVIDP